jgi:chemotaxis response regulator CheB
VEKIGVLLVQGQKGILSDIIRDVLEADPTVDVVTSVTAGNDIVDAVRRSRCDAVVWMLKPGQATGVPEELLRRQPSLRIVAVEGTGKRGSLWLMRPHRMPLGDLSPKGIISKLRETP